MRPGDDDTNFAEGSWWSRILNWSLQPRILGTVVLAGLFVVVIPALPALWPTINQRPKFPMSADRIDLTAATNWAPHDIVQRVASQHRGWNDRTLLDRSLVADLAAAFAREPWIEKVDRVEKTRQGRVVVQVTYRTPVAMVETIGGLHPIDAQGVLLPSKDISFAESNQLPHLRGIRSLPNGDPGQPWGDPIVTAGAKLCSELISKGPLDSHWNRFGLEAVIAPPPSPTPLANAAEPLAFKLMTTGGRLIMWGRPPGDDALEPTVVQKLGRIEEYINHFGSLDLPPADGLAIDLRPADSIGRIAVEQLDSEVLR